MFMKVHVHTLTAKLHTFHAEAEALLCGSLSAQLDLATCPNDALPRY
jgi:hypothetical protein